MSAIKAVEAAVGELENCPLFNAGKGAVFNSVGQHEMDASIMDGKTLNAGAIAAVRNVKNPIYFANLIREHSDHILLVGDGALEFGKKFNVEIESDDYFYTEHRYSQWQKIKGSDNFQLDHTSEKKYLGTVGAVALDNEGNLAAATSTGGMTNKKFGRIGDSPLIGLGNYANNNTCAVSCTGSGEYLMRAVSAYDISCLMEYKGLSLQEAAEFSILNKLTALGGDGGVVSIDQKGNIAMVFNCDGMYRASRNQKHNEVAIYR
ncbi:UNVERIFIED_CONTAM: hypothetical protein GTU68_045577 [Idotea baltica]|nr:hypothetical protein [Idotea baltica]